MVRFTSDVASAAFDLENKRCAPVIRAPDDVSAVSVVFEAVG
jgi:hypothetical protein